MDIKDFRGAIDDYTKAIQIYPEFASAYFNRGLSKIILKQKDSGCLDYCKAAELGDKKAYEKIKEDCQEE